MDTLTKNINNDLFPCERCHADTPDPRLIFIRDAQTGKMRSLVLCPSCVQEHDWDLICQPFNSKEESDLWKFVSFRLKALRETVTGNVSALEKIEDIVSVLDKYFVQEKCLKR